MLADSIANHNYGRLGTTSPIYVPGPVERRTAVPGESYIQISINSAQAAFASSFWHRVNHLVVTSTVSVGHSALAERTASRSIQLMRDVRPRNSEQLGLQCNLIDLIPTDVSSVSIGIEFILDRKNRLKQLSSLIQDRAFSAAFSLTPIALGVVSTVSTLAAKVIDTFIDEADRKPILQFRGDFNIEPQSDGGVRGGYYVILGSRDRPLPDIDDVEVRDSTVYANDKQVLDVSYVVLEVYVTPLRGLVGSSGSSWRQKLDEIKGNVSGQASDPFATVKQNEKVLRDAIKELREVSTLLHRDPLYTRTEATQIIRQAAANFTSLLGNEETTFGSPFGVDRELYELTGLRDKRELADQGETYTAQVQALHAELMQKVCADNQRSTVRG